MYRSDKVYYVVVLGEYLGIYGLRHIITLDIDNKKTMEQIKKDYYKTYCNIFSFIYIDKLPYLIYKLHQKRVYSFYVYPNLKLLFIHRIIVNA